MLSKTPTITRIMVFISGSLLLLSFVAPLWRISLWAPQYPEGLSMEIWTSKFTGDIQTINILNHYIGMKPITVESFPELVFFPKIFLALAIIGILLGLAGRKITNYLWTVLLLGFCVWSLYDFYSWEYKFGHELNPDAPIKMEDIVYQPPLIGEKTFLNIVATSYPSTAGVGLLVASLLALGASIITFRKMR